METVKEAAGRRGTLTEGQKAQVEYWTEFGTFLDSRGARFKPPKPSPSNWMQWRLGRSGASLSAIANAKEILVKVVINSRDHPSWFLNLEGDKDEIEGDLGFKLAWVEKPGNKHSDLGFQTQADARSPDKRPAAFHWMLKQMDALDRVFRPRIKDLDDNPLPDQESMV